MIQRLQPINGFVADVQAKEGLYPVTYSVGLGLLEKDAVPVDKQAFNGACRLCHSHARNGGCPPFAPSFESLYVQTLGLYWLRMDWEQLPIKIKSKWDDPNWRNWFLACVYMDVLLSTKVANIARQFRSLGYLSFDSGNCRGCNGKCAFKDNPDAICKQPKKRMFSLEATGIDVETIMEDYWFPLQWFPPREKNYAGSRIEYMCKVGGIGFKEPVSKDLEEKFQLLFIDAIGQIQRLREIL